MHLTPRETEVLQLLLTGKRTTECAKSLGMTTGTFKQHAHRVYMALGVSGRVELMAKELGK